MYVIYFSTSILLLNNVIAGINSSTSESSISSSSVNDFNAVDTPASSPSYSNIVDSSGNKSDKEDNFENLQKNNHDAEDTHINCNDSNIDSNDNQDETPRKTTGISKILQI